MSDTIAQRMLAAAAGLHVLLFAMFVLTLVSAASAFAEAPGKCTGQDLVERLRAEAPEKLATASAEAAEVENGNAIFWRVSRPGTPDSWLFGTMHSSDPRISRLKPEVEHALDTATTVLVENTDAMDPVKMAAAMMELRDLTFLSGGATLDALVSDDRVDQLRREVEARNMPWQIGRLMQPWLVAATISVPVCELEHRGPDAQVLDRIIVDRAREDGKALHSLETIEEQFSAVQGIPREFHLNALEDTLELGELSADLMETTKQLYLQGNTALVLPLVRQYSPRAHSGPGYAEFRERMLSNRNRTMANRASEFLEKGGAFIAVGAMHLPGKDGLVNLIHKAGYRVEGVSL